MKKTSPKMEHTTWPVAELRPHPKQAEYFRSLPTAMICALAKDIDANKLREPLEILVDGTLISGHQRLRAVHELGWMEVNVVVRHDLAALGEEAIEHRLLECNLNRRHLSILEFARCYKRLKELASAIGSRDTKGDLRDIIGKRLGKSGRTLDRLLPLLDLPREIQKAVDDKKLPVKTAAKLAKLPEKAQAKVVNAIVNGGNLRMTVFDVLHAHGLVGRKEETSEQLKARLRSLLLQGRRLAGESRRLQPMVRENQVARLQELAEFVLSLCPADRELTKNGKPRKKKTRAKPRAPR